MTVISQATRAFEPGTTGWAASDLDDPEVAARWEGGRYEIVEGVLTKMPAAYYAGGHAVHKLILTLSRYLDGAGLPSNFSTELDLLIDETRVLVADGAWFTQDDLARQVHAAQLSGHSDTKRTRILVPPTLVIESVSPGHELHDRIMKRKWYAEFGVGNYWIIDAFSESMLCLTLRGDQYQVDAEGQGHDLLHPSFFPGLTIALGELWS